MSGASGISITVIFQIICTLAIAIFGFFIKRELKRLDDADTANKSEIKETKLDLEKKLTELKDDYNKYKADMPFNFVTRDEFIRAMTNFDRKLDKIYDCITKKGSDCES
jgi:hypothetical protein